jgi:ligand-binding SRPBCC domain-containing protein
VTGRAGSDRTLVREQFFPNPSEEVFEPFSRAENLEAITPPWLGFQIVTQLPIEMREGAMIEYKLRFHGVPVRWRTEIVVWDPPHRFVDLALRSPFALWHHTHEFEEVDGGTLARDTVRYRVGFGPLGELAHALVVGKDLEAIFDFRREAITRLITR